MSGHGSRDENNRKIPMILYGDGLKQGQFAADCKVYPSHMDGYPTVMEYLRIPVKEEWDLDGRSRIEWALSETEQCELS